MAGRDLDLQRCKKIKNKSPASTLKENLLRLIINHNIDSCTLPNDIPRKWEKHGDLILIPFNSLRHALWHEFGDEVWNVVAASLNCKRLARKHPINNDDFRSSHVQLLKGDCGWVTRIDDGIKITFDITKCMFSAGNISEKLRISKFDCTSEIVVDLYAGIGYFTLPFLVHAKASKVHACEWNPDAIEALKRNLQLNDVQDKCIIYAGDNREVCPKDVADRVNLGLIPSSELSWRTACGALKHDSGGILHIHGLVTSGLKTTNHFTANNNSLSLHSQKKLRTEWINYAETMCNTLSSIFIDLYKQAWLVDILHIEYVKAYAPRINHLVVDVKCIPS